MKTRFACLFGLGASLLLGSCQDDPEPAATLLDTRWTLKQVDDTSVSVSSNSEEYKSFIQFKADNTAFGAAACNALTGTFSSKTGTQQLTVSPQGITYVYCGKTPITDRYTAALLEITRYKIEGSTLRLYDASAPKPRLIFEAL